MNIRGITFLFLLTIIANKVSAEKLEYQAKAVLQSPIGLTWDEAAANTTNTAGDSSGTEPESSPPQTAESSSSSFSSAGGEPAPPTLSPADRLAKIEASTINMYHQVPLDQNLQVKVVDCLGRTMPFAQVRLEPELDPGFPSTTELPNLIGKETKTDSVGVANFKDHIRFMNCSNEGWTFVARICPVLNSRLEAGQCPFRQVQCSNYVRLVLKSNTDDVQMELHKSDGDGITPANLEDQTPADLGSAIVGAMIPRFSIRFLSSCGEPMGSESSVQNELTRSIAQSTTKVKIESNEIAGEVLAGVTSDPATGLYLAVFEKAGIISLPQGVSVSKILLSFQLTGEGLKGLFESTLTAVAGGALLDGTVPVVPTYDTLLPVSITFSQLELPKDGVTKKFAVGSDEVTSSIQKTVRHHLFSEWSLSDTTAKQALADDPVVGKVLDGSSQKTTLDTLDVEYTFFCFRFSLHVLNSNLNWVLNDEAQGKATGDRNSTEVAFLDLDGQPNTLMYFNSSLVARTGFGLGSTPRGLQYGMQEGMLKTLTPFSVVEYDAQKGERFYSFVLPFALGQESTLQSTLKDFIEFQFVPNAFVSPAYVSLMSEPLNPEENPAMWKRLAEGGSNNNAQSSVETGGTDGGTGDKADGSAKVLTPGEVQQQSTVRIDVEGMEISLLGRYRQFSTITAIINPDIAYVSTMIAVADCSADVGGELDLSIHPMFVGIGSNPLTDYLVGALVCNSIILIVVGAVTFILGKKSPSKSFQASIFPHYLLHIATVLYPGTTYCAYALLPFITGTWYIFWIFPGALFFFALPVSVWKLSDSFTPTYHPTHFGRLQIMSKIFAPLGYYEPSHFDHVRYRFVYESFRGGQQNFYLLDFLSWAVTSGMAYFRDCRYRFMGPMITNVIFFGLLLSRAPHITTYRNVLAFVSSLVKIVAVAHLAWEQQEAKFTTILSAWLVILPLLSISFVFFEYVTQRFLKLDFMINDARQSSNMSGFLVVDNLEADDRKDYARRARRDRLAQLKAQGLELTREEQAELAEAEQEMLEVPMIAGDEEGFADEQGADLNLSGEDPGYNGAFEDLSDGWEIVEDGGPNGDPIILDKHGVPVLDAHDMPLFVQKEQMAKLRLRTLEQPDVLADLAEQDRQRVRREGAKIDREKTKLEKRDEILRRLKDRQSQKETGGVEYFDEDWNMKSHHGKKHKIKGDGGFAYTGTEATVSLNDTKFNEFLSAQERASFKERKRAERDSARNFKKKKSGKAGSPAGSPKPETFDDWTDDVFKPWQSHTQILQEIQQVVTETRVERERRETKAKEEEKFEQDLEMAMRPTPSQIDQEQALRRQRSLPRPKKPPTRERGILKRLPDGSWIETGLVPKDAAFLVEAYRRRKREDTVMDEYYDDFEGEMLQAKDDDEPLLSAEEHEARIRERRTNEMRRKLLLAKEEALKINTGEEEPATYVYEPRVQAKIPSRLDPFWRKLADEKKAERDRAEGKKEIVHRKIKIDHGGTGGLVRAEDPSLL